MLSVFRDKLLYGSIVIQGFVFLLVTLIIVFGLFQVAKSKQARTVQLKNAAESLQQQLYSHHMRMQKYKVGQNPEVLTPAVDIAQAHNCVMAMSKSHALFKCTLSQQASFLKALLQAKTDLDIQQVQLKKQKQFVIIELGLKS